MTYLDPQSINIGSVVSMAAIAQVNPVFVPNPKGFKINIWDLNMDSTTESPTLRLFDGGGLQTTGYNVQKWDKTNGAAYSQTSIIGTTTNATWVDPFGTSSSGLVYGYWEGRLMEESSDTWALYGWFRDDFTNDRTQVEVSAQIVLDSPCTGARVQSANASNWSAGSLSFQSWK